MATDKTEPRTMMILGIGIFSIVTLLVTRFALQSYYINMTEEEQYVKIASQPATQVHSMRAAEAERLASGAMPIAEAMRAIAGGQRPALIAPQASTDIAPLQGWSQRPVNLAPAGVTSAPAPGAPAPAATPAGTVGGPTAVQPEANADGGVPTERGGTQPGAAHEASPGGGAVPAGTHGPAGATNAANAPVVAPAPAAAPPSQGPTAAPTNTTPQPGAGAPAAPPAQH